VKALDWVMRGIIFLLLVALAVTAKAWAPFFFAFLRLNTDLLLAMEAALAIVMWIGAAVVAFFTVKNARSAAALPAPPTQVNDSPTAIGGGDAMSGGTKIVIGQLLISPESFGRLLGDGARAVDARQVTERYFRFILDRYRYLDFKGMGVSDRVPLRLALEDMYVPLKARCELPRGESWERDPEVAGRALRNEAEQAERGGRGTMALHDLWEQHGGIVILGDPGSGKTTFLKHVALQVVGQFDVNPRLPVLVSLSAYANALATRPQPIDVFLEQFFADAGVGVPIGKMLRLALQRGRAIIMLDGLDEVKDTALRTVVVKQVETFYAFHRSAGNRFLLTSRIIGYQEVRPSGEDLVECTLVDFDDEEIESFVRRWTTAVERAAHDEDGSVVAEQDAESECTELLAAIRRHPGVRRLAANPLLLTILALMKRQGVTLPERRVELYDTYVKVLLSTWNRVRGLGRPPTRDLDVKETLKVLAPLALWMHEASPGAGLVKRFDMETKLREIYGGRHVPDPEASAERLLEDVRDYSGLILERGAGQYGFIHLTFEEYLAAVALAQLGQQDVTPITESIAAHVDEPAWRESSLLAIGHLGIVQGREEAAGSVIEALLDDRSTRRAALTVLAGDAVVDGGSASVTPGARDHTVTALRGVMCDIRITPVLRAAAGNTLGRLGDPRFHGADGWFLPIDPPFGFIEIPAGEFTMGEDTEIHRVALPAYYIGKYPVTVAQFRAFVEANPGFKVSDPDCLKGPANHPVVWVTWHEALAYCAWLTGVLRGRQAQHGALFSAFAGRKWTVTLPSEAEWEKAARGTDARRYPWGPDWDANRANCNEAGIGSTSAVGCFPGGASPYRVEDMSGNVWEWTRSLYREYPYVAGDGREDLKGDEARVLRGGCWRDDSPGHFRCASRGRGVPSCGLDYFGFRCVLASPGP